MAGGGDPVKVRLAGGPLRDRVMDLPPGGDRTRIYAGLVDGKAVRLRVEVWTRPDSDPAVETAALAVVDEALTGLTVWAPYRLVLYDGCPPLLVWDPDGPAVP